MTNEIESPGSALWEVLSRLDRDLRQSSSLLTPTEARFLCDFYYQIQRDRIRSNNQVSKTEEEHEPNRVLTWFADSTRKLEDDIKRALDSYSNRPRVGLWMKSIVGIGPVLSAGFLSHLDIRTTGDTPCHWWRLAGLDPTFIWYGKDAATKLVTNVAGKTKGTLSTEQMEQLVQLTNRPLKTFERVCEGTYTVPRLITYLSKLPWNKTLKTLCFKLGDCFVKFQNHKNDFYGKIYVERKAYESNKNEHLEYKEQAEQSLAKYNYGKDTEARKWYEQGKLSPGHIHMRCLRYTVKLFLSHFHHVCWKDFHDVEPAKPYPFSTNEQGKRRVSGDHRHFLPPPNYPFTEEVKTGISLKEFYPTPHE